MIPYILYNEVDGRIVRTGICGENDLQGMQGSGLLAIEGAANDAVHYVDNGIVLERPVMPISVDKTNVIENEIVTISNIPIGTEVYIDGDLYTINDGEIQVDFDSEGVYIARLHLFPYKDHEVIIECA